MGVAEKGSKVKAITVTASQVPTAVAIFPKELYQAPRAWAASKYNLKQWSVFKSGGVGSSLPLAVTLYCVVHNVLLLKPLKHKHRYVDICQKGRYGVL